jgi:hypothetical protein
MDIDADVVDEAVLSDLPMQSGAGFYFTHM